jgi:hypothetical protein
MPESQSAAAVSPWAKPWSEDSYYSEDSYCRDIRAIARSEANWRRRNLLFVAIASLALWALILSPILLFL